MPDPLAQIHRLTEHVRRLKLRVGGSAPGHLGAICAWNGTDAVVLYDTGGFLAEITSGVGVFTIPARGFYTVVAYGAGGHEVIGSAPPVASADVTISVDSTVITTGPAELYTALFEAGAVVSCPIGGGAAAFFSIVELATQ